MKGFDWAEERAGRTMVFVVSLLFLVAPFANVCALWDDGTDHMMDVPEGDVLSVEDMSSDLMPFDFGGLERDLIFLLHSINGSETNKVVVGTSTDKYMDTTLDFNGSSVITSITTQTSFTWYLVPALAANVTATHFDFKIWIWATSTSGTPQGSINVSVSEVNTTTSTLVTSKNTGDIFFTRSAELRTVSNDFNHTFKNGTTIAVKMTITLTAGDSITFAYDTAKANSRFLLRTSDGAGLNRVFTTDNNNITMVTFDPLAANKTVRLKTNISDPLGCYDIKWANVTVVSPRGMVVVNNATMTRESGADDDPSCTFSRDWNYSGQFNGRYDFTVWLTDNSGHNHFYHLQNYDWGNYTSGMDGFFTIGEMVYVNVKVFDSTGVPLVNAMVSLEDAGSGDIVDQALTNSTGMHNFSTTFKGNYHIKIYWEDVQVANVSQTVASNVSESSPVVINANVYYPAFSVLDGKGLGVGGASVFLTHPNGSARAVPIRTDANGGFNLTQTANGTYRLRIVWMDVVVNDTMVQVTSNAAIIVRAAVFYLDITVVDSRSVPLAGAQVVLANSTSLVVFDSKITNLSGGYGFRLPGGAYDISVFWQNSLVHLTLVHVLNSDKVLTLTAAIYYLVINVVDTSDGPVESAHVVVTGSEGNVLDTNFTDPAGRIDSRLPQGSHIVTVYWMGVEVNSSTVLFTGDSQVTIHVAVNRPSFRVVDADGDPVAKARIDIALNGTRDVLASLTTDDGGNASVRLPAAKYDITVLWMDVVVSHEYNVPLVSDVLRPLPVAIFNVEVRCIDSRDVPLKDATVSMFLSADGREMASVYTGENGTVSMRLPGGTYDLGVKWQGVTVSTVIERVIEISGTFIVKCDVFYLDGQAVDTKGIGLPGALVTVSDANGSVLHTMMTDEGGTIVARLPIGTYDISISWEGRSVNGTKGLVLNADLEVKFGCRVYYVELLPMDSRAVPLGDATLDLRSVTVQGAGVSATTSVTGPVKPLTFRLPGDNYDLTVLWLGVTVNETMGMVISSDLAIDIQCSVHYLKVITVDSDGRMLQGAGVSLSMTAVDGCFSEVSDDIGTAGFRLPAMDYDITISWRGIGVFEQKGRTLAADDTWLVTTAVFYPKFVLLDSRSAPVGGAQVELFRMDGVVMDAGTTADDGSIGARLAADRYRIACSWLGTLILDTTVDVLQNGPINLMVSVHYLDLAITDSRGLAVGEAVVDVSAAGRASVLSTTMTDETGNATVRLPGGIYEISVTWLGAMVLDIEGLELRSDVTRSEAANVFYLSLIMVDDAGRSVEGALVDLTAGGRIMGSAISGDDGRVVIRLPIGNYGATMTWRTVVVGGLTDIALVSDKDITVPMMVHYLTVHVRDGTGKGLKGATVLVQGEGIPVMDAAQTPGNGTIVFRLPEGKYSIKAEFSSTYLMSGYSSSRESSVTLSGSSEVSLGFKDYPPQVYTTNTFALVLSIVVLLLVILGTAMKLLRSSPKV